MTRDRRAGAAPALAAGALGSTALVLTSAAFGEALARSLADDVSARYTVLVCALALLTTAPLALLRPAVAAVAITAASVLSLVPFHLLTGAGAIAQVIVLYRASRCGSALLTAGLGLPFLAVALADPAGTEVRVLAVLLAAAAPGAAWAGTQRGARAQADAHAALGSTLLEHTARGERARIARELHDVVAHHISMIAVQAETARLTTADLPANGVQRFSAIGDTARLALTEMRRLLGVLREDTDDDTSEGNADRTPQPDLRQLTELLDQARDAAGTSTRLVLRGPPDPLDPGVELAAYRIIQEALTNARRHAPGAAIDVELHYTDDTLQIRIRDNGPGPPAAPLAGHGLLGMSERATAVGGTLHTGAAPGGGFLIEASLPAKADQ